MTRERILVVEDDHSLAEVVVYNMRQLGYEVSLARDGQDALHQAQKHLPDLVILDLMLPVIDGLEVCRRLRADPKTKTAMVLMLTAKGEEADQMIGFKTGADDYVTKPFSVQVLSQRAKALLRRRQQTPQTSDFVSSQGIEIDRTRHRATAGGRSLDLTPSEFDLLDTLVRQPGRAFNRDQLIDAALGADTVVLERTIDVHIRSLRSKLDDHAELIETVRGVGYRFRDPGGD